MVHDHINYPTMCSHGHGMCISSRKILFWLVKWWFVKQLEFDSYRLQVWTMVCSWLHTIDKIEMSLWTETKWSEHSTAVHETSRKMRRTWNSVSCAERVVASVWRVWTFRSSSVIYRAFLSFDRAADCLFAMILHQTKLRNSIDTLLKYRQLIQQAGSDDLGKIIKFKQLTWADDAVKKY